MSHTLSRCTTPGCAKKEKAKGLCSMHYARRQKGLPAYPEAKPMYLSEALYRLVTPKSDAECWEFEGTRDKNGYGMLSFQKHLYRAHRVSYECSHGVVVVDNFVLHKCDNPPCVNPNHLFLGDAKANSDDMITKGRQAPQYGTYSPRAKLTDEMVIEARRSEKTTAALAAEYDVSVSCLSAARLGRTWKHLAVPPISPQKAARLRSMSSSVAMKLNRQKNPARYQHAGLTGETNPRAKLTNETVKQARWLFAQGMTQTAIAHELGVDSSTISLVVRGLGWAHVDP